MTTALTKAEILGSKSTRKIEPVEVPELGGTVYVIELSGDGRDKFDSLVMERGGNLIGLRSELVALCLCDESGELLGFTDAEVKELGEKSGAAIDRIFEAAKQISGIDEGSQEDAEKNLPSDQSENSG